MKYLIREAAFLGRVPVLLDPAECLSRWHNLHFPVQSSWDDYFDFENIPVTFNFKAGVQHLILSAATEAEFNALNIPETDILRPDSTHVVTPEENTRYRAVVRYLPEGTMWSEQLPPGFDCNAFAHGTATPADAEAPGKTVGVVFNPSRRAREMADRVVKQLPTDYCAMHIRRADVLVVPEVIKATSMRFILQKLDEFGVRPGTTLFVLTDELRRRYLNPLKKKYRIVRYFDFLELKSLTTRPGPVDYHLLYIVENEILKQAEKKIYSFQTTVNKTRPGSHYLLEAKRHDVWMRSPPTLRSKIERYRVEVQRLLPLRCNPGKHEVKVLYEMSRDLCKEIIKGSLLHLRSWAGSRRRKNISQ